MTTIRLLPVVIFAAIALLVFKGVGIVTTGGYVLTGTSAAIAAGGAPAAGGGAGPTLALPEETTMVDTAPVLSDGAPTMPGEGAKKPGSASGGHDAPAAAPAGPAPADAASGAGGEDHGTGPADDSGHGTPAPASADAAGHGGSELDPACAPTPTGGIPSTCPGATDDTLPMRKIPGGDIVPMVSADGLSPSESAVIARLAQRRAELDALEGELTMRESLIQAAEKRLEERTAALQALEARISAMVEEKKAAEEGQFGALVKMYEGMKPADAATIFEQLEMTVLVRLARSMNPRKMAPIMAKMDPKRAQELTTQLADEQSQPVSEVVGADLASLPQIVGQ